MLVAELTMPFPWGLCFLEDPGFGEEVPPIEGPEMLTSSARTALSVVVLNEIDGDATVRLHVGPVEPPGELILNGTIESVTGELRLTDATAVTEARAIVGVGTYPVRVFADQAPGPQNVDIVLGAEPLGR